MKPSPRKMFEVSFLSNFDAETYFKRWSETRAREHDMAERPAQVSGPAGKVGIVKRRRSPPAPQPVDEAFEQQMCGLAFDKGADPSTDPRRLGDPEYLRDLRYLATLAPSGGNVAGC